MAAARSSAVPSSLPLRVRRRLRALNWGPVAGLAGGSLVFSIASTSYLFGLSDHFFGRIFTAFGVVFGLLAFTFRAAVPFVGWAAANWFGRGWAAPPQPPSRGRERAPAHPPRRPRVGLPRCGAHGPSRTRS